MAATPVTRLVSLDGPAARQVNSIYSTSFPASQRMGFAELVKTVGDGQRLAYVVEDQLAVLGFAVLKPLSCGKVLLLEYMAVLANARNRGLGSTLLRGLAAHQANAGVTGILLEVEPPDEASGEERATRQRRIAFYAKNGAHFVEDASGYRMPNMSGDGSLPMLLLWLPSGQRTGNIPIQDLADCIVSIYTEAYDRDRSDPLLKSVLKRLPIGWISNDN